MPASVADQVADRIRSVKSAHSAAIAALQKKSTFGFRSHQVEQTIAAIESLAPRIDAWAASGSASAATGSLPAATGWPGWIKAGESLAAGVRDLLGYGETVTLADVRATGADVARDVAALQDKARETVKAAAADMGEVAASLLGPIAPILIAAAVVLVVVMRRGK